MSSVASLCITLQGSSTSTFSEKTGIDRALILHKTACNYPTPATLGSIGAAALWVRAPGMTVTETRHALGIVGYHSSWSQMTLSEGATLEYNRRTIEEEFDRDKTAVRE